MMKKLPPHLNVAKPLQVTGFSCDRPCDSAECVCFRKWIGTEGFETIFQMSV